MSNNQATGRLSVMSCLSLGRKQLDQPQRNADRKQLCGLAESRNRIHPLRRRQGQEEDDPRVSHDFSHHPRDRPGPGQGLHSVLEHHAQWLHHEKVERRALPERPALHRVRRVVQQAADEEDEEDARVPGQQCPARNEEHAVGDGVGEGSESPTEALVPKVASRLLVVLFYLHIMLYCRG